MANDLPEDTQLKRRARRRLIGAIALVLLAVIVLPMIFDAEQKPLDQDVSIQIPSQGDYVAKPPTGPAQPPAPPADAKAAPDAPKSVVPPKEANKDGKDTVTLPGDNKAPASVVTPPAPEAKDNAKAETKDAAKTEAKDAAKADAAKAKAEADTKAEARAEAEKAKTKAAADEKARAKAESERAAALLNGGDTAPTSSKSSDKNATAVASAGSFAIQIGAFSSVEKAQEVRDKLSAAGLSSYAEKVSSKGSEVTRVRAGPFPSKEAAEAARAKIAGLGFASASVVHR